jgi:hypothetical protein
MTELSAASLVDMWEWGLPLDVVRRPLLILSIAEPTIAFNELATWSIGRRDAALLTVHNRLFGSQLMTFTRCPSCGEAVETTFSTHDIHLPAPPLAADMDLRVDVDGYAVVCRVPNSHDLTAGLQTGDPLTLLERCVKQITRDEKPCTVHDMPRSVIEAISQALDEADPQSNIQIALTCPYCEQTWLALFDIAVYLWQEIDTHARRLLREVHALASVYCWSERDILCMSAWRRRRYLELMYG